MTESITTRDQAKARARAIRAEAALGNCPISHAAALERVAAELGAVDWNTLSAQLPDAPDIPLQVGDRVEGRYLNHAFEGSVRTTRSIGDGDAFEVTIDFDQPIDVVAFDSFSALRRRVTARISPSGVSFAKTSDGVPHLVVSRTDTSIV